MIQRIQSIFLFLSAASLGGLFGLPFASSDVSTSAFLSDQIYNIHDHVVLIILTCLGIVLALASLFMYKNRAFQMRLGIFTIISSVLLIAACIFLFLNEAKKIMASAQVDDQFGLYLPILAIIFAGLAIRFIKKDDNLVQSMDRLR